ncbi:hypothetical protein DN752_02305 [Echinicola strongylocentroti]|uniref:Uncharacterized protein n=1 Tax=Echinicola strongylocentroti TaxID=1795355 RepID=A0A2Z4IDE5_9BACT|nr:glycosyltransferase family 4 protein [Echinicola strongylocentroti]AWW29061.1 hypothetical protein DN752_02305 [Echinicola strongylocentroti]
MKVVYITYPWFLDFSIEYIKELSKKVALHVFVLTSEGKLSSTIFHLNEIPDGNNKKSYSFAEMKASLKDAAIFESYIQDCKGVDFMFFPKKRVGLKAIERNRQLGKMINAIAPDVIHLDDLSIELFGLRLFAKAKKWVIDVHDPQPHSGEVDWRRKLIRTLMYPRANAFLTFSEHSKRTFQAVYGRKKPVHNLSLVPYSFYSKYTDTHHGLEAMANDYLLFIGRVSQYKGVDDLVDSFSEITDAYPGLKLVIAGKWKANFSIPEEMVNHENIVVINRFLENEEVAALIRGSLAVVCPYKDATQSGVVMTSFGLDKGVIVSNVGGLPETVFSESGMVYDRQKEGGLTEALTTYLNGAENGGVFRQRQEISADYNTTQLVKLYQAI